MATEVSKDVIELHGEDDQQKDRPIIPIVRHVAEITERASEESKPKHTQTHALDVTFRLIEDQAACGNQRDGQRKQRNKEPIPIIQRGESDEENPDHHDETDGSFPKQAGNAGILPITKKTQGGHAQDRPESACENGNEDEQSQPNPGPITIPEFLSLIAGAVSCPGHNENQKRC